MGLGIPHGAVGHCEGTIGCTDLGFFMGRTEFARGDGKGRKKGACIKRDASGRKRQNRRRD